MSPFDAVGGSVVTCGKGYTSIEEKTIDLIEYLDDIGGYTAIACEDEYMYLICSSDAYWYSGETKKMLRINLTSYECSVISIENTTEKVLTISAAREKGILNNYFFIQTTDNRVCAINIYDSADTHIVKKSDGNDYIGSISILGNYEDRIVMVAGGISYSYQQAYFVTTEDFIARQTGASAYTFVYGSERDALYYGGMVEVKNSNRVMKAYRSNGYIYFYYPENILMTINNLEEPVTKTSTQSMKVTYVLSPE